MITSKAVLSIVTTAICLSTRKKYRVLPVDAIIEDMEVVNRQNDSIVVFGDENVSGYSAKDHENRVELFERMIKKRFSFLWGAQSTIDIYQKPELLELMRAAGCRALFVGLETTDSDLGEQVNKSFADRIDYKEAIRVIHSTASVSSAPISWVSTAMIKATSSDCLRLSSDSTLNIPGYSFLPPGPVRPCTNGFRSRAAFSKGTPMFARIFRTSSIPISLRRRSGRLIRISRKTFSPSRTSPRSFCGASSRIP
jgi:hypothetical protein